MKKDWRKYKIGDILIRVKDSFNLSELGEYKRVTVRGKGLGVSLRDAAKGLDKMIIFSWNSNQNVPEQVAKTQFGYR